MTRKQLKNLFNQAFTGVFLETADFTDPEKIDYFTDVCCDLADSRAKHKASDDGLGPEEFDSIVRVLEYFFDPEHAHTQALNDAFSQFSESELDDMFKDVREKYPANVEGSSEFNKANSLDLEENKDE